MPKDLDAPPEESGGKKAIKPYDVFRPTPPRRRGSSPHSGLVTFEEYEKLLSDRPEKFSAEQVRYRKAEDPGKECEHCIHFYKQIAGEQRTVCEILRLEPEKPIDPEYVCDFLSRDGEEYPYQKKSSSQSPDVEEEER